MAVLLGIETSCDDTAGALLDGNGRVLASVVSSQVAHQRYGGVVPEIASREHLRNWPLVAERLFCAGGVAPSQLDAVAATAGPGLVGSLLVGLQIAKGLAFARGVPFYAVDHLEGHLYSPFLRVGENAVVVPRRFCGLVVSGGHTCLYDVIDENPRLVAQTRDDALGECFDKIGKRLGLPFPAGAAIDRLAERAEEQPRGAAPPSFSVARCGTSLDFSFSGLKTQALLAIEQLERRGVPTTIGAPAGGPASETIDAAPEVLEMLVALRAAGVAQIVERLSRHHQRAPFDRLAVSGGVAANRALRRELVGVAARRSFALDLVALDFAGDNAAMIAHAALLRWRQQGPADGFSTGVHSRSHAAPRAAQRRGGIGSQGT